LYFFRGPIAARIEKHTYHLSTNRIDTWQPYGGTWDVEHGVIHNNSDERGAKLMSGSTRWRDYTFQTDIKFDGEHGDMGLVLRSNDEEEGVDAYDGYYVGLRTTDDTLLIGRSEYGWIEAMPVAMPGGVHPSGWYRLRVTAVGCNLVASSENLATGQHAWMSFTEHACVLSGRIGLRSVGTGGTWRDLTVVPATAMDYRTMANHAGPVERPEFPTREADYNRHFRLLTSENPPAIATEENTTRAAMETHIGDLQTLPRTQQTEVILRGVVTLTSPDLYVEDSSGGLVVHAPQAPPLNVGDGVEVIGPAQPTLYSAVVSGGAVRVISSGTPVPPISITPWQAASGAYDARFIEIEAHLKREVYLDNGQQVLEFAEGGQVFRALYADRPGGLIRGLEKNSFVRLRGVCVVGRHYMQDLIPFVVLLRSRDDIQVLAGPPWWTPWHLGMSFAGVLIFASALQVIYFRIQHWKMQAITQERERLAHDIHDTMAQSFAGIGYQMQGIRTSVLRDVLQTPRQIGDQLEAACLVVRKCHQEASRTIAMLSSYTPDVPNDLGQALAENVHMLAGNRIRALIEIEGSVVQLNPRLANALLHIGQEAISNAIAHSSPTLIAIKFTYEAKSVTLTVTDNGGGFEYSPGAAGFGIRGMQMRAQEMSGKLEIRSAPGAGTRVCVKAKLLRRHLRRRMVARIWERHPVQSPNKSG
jgi:signal transduction histidine kinase